MKKKFLCALLSMVLTAVLLAGCAPRRNTVNPVDTDSKPPDTTADTQPSGQTAPDDSEEAAKTIAISLPDQSLRCWTLDAANMKQGLEALGYNVVIQYAGDRPKRQAAQIKDFITAGADCIVIAAVNSKKLTAVEAAAQDAGIPIIAYDSLLMDTDAVSFYTTFDHKGIGNLIGRTIVEKAELDDLADGEYKTIEFFMGDADDSNSLYIYNGLMEVLQPYLDHGTLVCNTGRTSFADTCIANWSQDTARNWCENYLEGYYKDEDLDICATAFDGFAYGCKEAFMAAGYTQNNWPVISGQNCETQACKNILDGTQTFSICKDTRMLAAKCVETIDAIMNGTEPEVNNAELYDNHVMIVPACMCSPLVIDADNLQEVLIDGGYYTEEELDTYSSAGDFVNY